MWRVLAAGEYDVGTFGESPGVDRLRRFGCRFVGMDPDAAEVVAEVALHEGSRRVGKRGSRSPDDGPDLGRSSRPGGDRRPGLGLNPFFGLYPLFVCLDPLIVFIDDRALGHRIRAV